jgi:hypothetical protein
LHFGKMGKGSKRGKTYTKAFRKAAALPVKGANSTHMTKGRVATEHQERNHQHQPRGDGSYHTHKTAAAGKGRYFGCRQISHMREIEG